MPCVKTWDNLLAEGCQESFEKMVLGLGLVCEYSNSEGSKNPDTLVYSTPAVQRIWEYYRLAWKEARGQLLSSFAMNVVGWRRSQASGGGHWIHQFHETEPPLNGYPAVTKVEALVVLPECLK